MKKVKLRLKLKLIIFCSALTVIIVSFWLWQYNPSNNLKVIFLDVGQGDSILIKTPDGQVVLIDGGPDRSVLTALADYLPWWDKTIDLIILTHPHDDHLVGLNYVLDNYQVKTVIYNGLDVKTGSYLAWLDKIKNKQIFIINSARTVDLGSCNLNILYPDHILSEQMINNLNDTSIVSKLICDSSSWLFTGDIEEVEQYLLESGVDLKADVLKVAHHGSDTSTSLEFLKAVQPEIAVISLGQDNYYGFPDSLVINRLKRLVGSILRTDQQGSIVLEGDSQKIWR